MVQPGEGQAGGIGAKSPWPGLGFLLAGHGILYLYVLLAGQTVPREASLRQSWLFPGWPMALPLERSDLPDWNCWMDWRGQFPTLFSVFGSYLLLRRLFAGPRAGLDGMRPLPAQRYMHGFGLLFVVAMHGIGGTCILALIASVNYLLAQAMAARMKPGTAQGTGWAMLAIWAFNIPMTSFMFWFTGEEELGAGMRLYRYIPDGLQEILSFQGIGPWFMYRFMCLRFISFACDAILAAAEGPQQASARRQSSDDSSVDFVTYATAHPHGKDKYFGFHAAWYYITYLTYPPLYVLGPFLSYNGFVAQLDRPRVQRPARELAKYAQGMALYALALEVSMHFFYYPGWLGSEAPVDVLLGLPLAETAVATHVLLNFEFTSLLVMWRFSRFVALLDGVDTFENMPRNINLICSFQEMWRNWHVSLNKFCVRYIYVPMGGKKRPLFGVVATFLFVSFWHEVNGVGTAMHWYLWGALNCIFVLFEKLVVARIPIKGYLATAVLGAVTYHFMQSVEITAMMTLDVTLPLSVRLLKSWVIVLPPVLYGLQGVLAAEAAAAPQPKAGSRQPGVAP